MPVRWGVGALRPRVGAAVLSAGLAAVVAFGGGEASAQDGEAVPTREVVVRAASDDVDPPLVVDRLAPQTVLTVRAGGFDPDTTGTARQCVDGTECDNSLAVRFDEDGLATFQYLITDEVGGVGASDPCRLGGPRCTIELRVGETTTVIDTVFVDAAPPPGELSVSPDSGLQVGDTVTVTAAGFAPGADLTVLVCAGRATTGPRCGAPGPVVPLMIGPDGSAEAEFAVPPEVGADRISCGRRARCLVAVSSPGVGVWARPVTLAFAEGPTADYDLARVMAGLTAALGLVVVAAWVIRTTDWRPPPEADSSAIDDAQYADLDLEAEQFVDPVVDEEAAGV